MTLKTMQPVLARVQQLLSADMANVLGVEKGHICNYLTQKYNTEAAKTEFMEKVFKIIPLPGECSKDSQPCIASTYSFGMLFSAIFSSGQHSCVRMCLLARTKCYPSTRPTFTSPQSAA